MFVQINAYDDRCALPYFFASCFSLCLAFKTILKAAAFVAASKPFDCSPQKSLRIECVVLCCACLWSLMPNNKNWLDLSAHSVPGFVCRLMLDTCSYQRWNRNIFQWRELPVSGDLPSPVGSQGLLPLAKSQLECDKVLFNVNGRWLRCGLDSRTTKPKKQVQDSVDLMDTAKKNRILLIHLWMCSVLE